MKKKIAIKVKGLIQTTFDILCLFNILFNYINTRW